MTALESKHKFAGLKFFNLAYNTKKAVLLKYRNGMGVIWGFGDYANFVFTELLSGKGARYKCRNKSYCSK